MRRQKLRRERFGSLLKAAAMIAMTGITPLADAYSFNLFGLNGDFTLNGTYAYAVRIESADSGVIDAPGRPEIPIPDALKYPESNNFDDGDRNFDKWQAVNNRATVFGELDLKYSRDTGIKISGDAFYDFAYHGHNDNDAPDRLNSRQQPPDSFTDAAEYYDGRRARLLDAYAFTSIDLGRFGTADIKLGRQVTAWGQSLFFSGVALAQSPADATKATVPGASVKSILLPTTQLSTRITLTNGLTLLGQWKLEYKTTELNPDGDFYSLADIIGPGAEFAYGIKNPLFLDTLSNFDLTDPNDLQQIADVLDTVLGTRGVDTQQALGTLVSTLVNGPLGPAIAALPTVSLPQLGNLLNAPKGINVQRGADITPDQWDADQWGAGLEYNLTYTTTIGYYHLNYHSTQPTVEQEFGSPVLARGPGGATPITGATLGLFFPIVYHVEYFKNIKLDALSFSTVAFGANIGGEFIRRDGVDVLVDVDSGLTGPIPTPTRAKTYQALLNGIYTLGPGWLWDSLTLVGSVGYAHIGHVTPVASQARSNQGELFDTLTYDTNAAAFATMLRFGKRSVFPGWDLQVPVSIQGAVYNHTALGGAFGSLLGPRDYRLGISLDFTHLQRLTLGFTYNGYLGSPDFDDRPYQDRDNIAVTAKYQFL